MPNYRVVITVVLDPIEGADADAASHKGLELVQNAMCNDVTAHHFPDELSKAIGDGSGGLDCMIRGTVAKNVRQGDIVVDDSSVFFVTRTSRVEGNIVLGGVDDNDMMLDPQDEVTILDRKITKRAR